MASVRSQFKQNVLEAILPTAGFTFWLGGRNTGVVQDCCTSSLGDCPLASTGPDVTTCDTDGWDFTVGNGDPWTYQNWEGFSPSSANPNLAIETNVSNFGEWSNLPAASSVSGYIARCESP